MTHALEIARGVCFALVLLAALAFVGRYSVHTWWRTPEGQNLMHMSLCVVGIFGWLTLRPYLAISEGIIVGIDTGVSLAALVVVLARHRLLTVADRDAAAANPEE